MPKGAESELSGPSFDYFYGVLNVTYYFSTTQSQMLRIRDRGRPEALRALSAP